MDSANHYSRKSLFWMALFILSILFFSPEASWSITNIDGVTLNEDTTWTIGESPYVVSGTVEIGDGATLTVETGVIVKFASGSAIGIKVLSGGNFVVEGSAAAPVIFTDIRDDSAAGDTNGDQDASSPEPGAWDGIVVDDGGNANLQYAYFRYGEDGIFMTGSGSLLMDDCMVTGSEFNGVWLNFTFGINRLTRCTLKQNGWEGISIWDTLGNVSVNNCTISENGTNGIWISELPLVRFMGGLTVRFSAPVEIGGCVISDNTESGIKNENISSSIMGSSIADNAMYGIYVKGASTPEIFSNTVSRNNEGIRCEENADPLIGGSPENRNNIFKNAVFGVNNLSPDITVNATHNW